MARLCEKKYSVECKHLPAAFDGCRLVFLSDLHGSCYGGDNQELLCRIRRYEPEFILIGGDMMVGLGQGQTGENGLETAGRLILSLAASYPVYYAMGNHEGKCDPKALRPYFSELKMAGVRFLDNETVCLCRPGGKVFLHGLTLEQSWYPKLRRLRYPVRDLEEKLGKTIQNDGERGCHILLAHMPVYFRTYAEWGADLTLSGHFHGGVVRLPGIGGLIGPDFLPFPKYSGGLYRWKEAKLVVSCGLGSHTIPFRLFNPPELTLLTLRNEACAGPELKG